MSAQPAFQADPPRTAAIVYRSHTGNTRRLAEEICSYLEEHGIVARAASVGDYDRAWLAEADLLLLGCWTNGLFVIRQHPDEPWLRFARTMPVTRAPRVGLFTTYTLATGSMFSNMRRELAGKTVEPELELRSRDGRLSDSSRRALDAFLAGA